jgi:DNA polymerase-3 subunit alpha
MVQKAKELGMRAIALTDHGAMYGIHKFYTTCKQMDIKPILGCELYMARNTRFDRDAQKDKLRYHQLVLAKNEQGYKNLIKIVTKANLEGFYYKPRADWDLLTEYHEGLIVTSSCPQGMIPRAIIEEDMTRAREWTKKYIEVFGDDFYFELQKHDNLSICDTVNKGVMELSREFGVPVVATNDVHYVNEDDAEAQDALMTVAMKKMLDDPDRLTMLDSRTFYLKPPTQMMSEFSEVPDAIKNSIEIAEKCNVEILTGQRIMPHFPIPKGMTENDFLKDLTYKKAKKIFGKKFDQIKERIDYELGVIIDKGFAAYFLIYEDFVAWSKKHRIRVGPGRGSAAGSLVSYVLGITSINPLVHGLPFERFLNPQRPTPPDIDMDFADDRRDEVINYVRNKYGEDKVAQIITFGRMEAKAAIRDIGRVMGLPYAEPDRLSKMIPFGTSIEDTIAQVPEFKQAYQDKTYHKLIDLAKKVEGNVRHASIHAAAVVVAPKPFTEYCPLQRDERHNKILTQFDMYALDCNVSDDALGLLKMDFLGLRNLSILQKAIDLVKKHEDIEVDIDNVHLDEPKVYELFSAGETTGVFQMESAGMRRVARSLKPSTFSDISALVALYRPGPMDLIDDFIKGKEHPDQIKYPHQDLKPVLEETYGIAVYQEQCLQIAHVMAGYSLGEADILRRAIGKKKISILKKEKEKFLKGSKDKGYTKSIAETVWGYIEKFAGYGFNKAHSASYGMIAYQTAWMKVTYPVAYMTALMTAESQNTDKIAIAIEECKRMKIKVHPPDINKSQMDFTIEEQKDSLNDQAIRFGLNAIKNVGSAAIENILQARESGGDFISLTDLFTRVDNQKVNKKIIESLIQVGAFDAFGKRAALLAAYEDIRSKSMSAAAKKASGQTSLFETMMAASGEDESSSMQDDLPDVVELNQKQMLLWEKELLGLYLTDNPYSRQMAILSHAVSHNIDELDSNHDVGKHIVIGGMLGSIRKVFTKRNNAEMAFGTLEDQTGLIDMVIFPKVYAEHKELLASDQVIICEGKLDYREDKLNIIVDKISQVKENDIEYLQEQVEIYELEIPRGTPRSTMEELSKLLKQNPGRDKLIICIPNGSIMPKKINLPYTVNYNKDLQKKVYRLLH